MSDSCCEANCEGPYEDVDIYVKNEGKDLKRWLKFLRWIGIKIEPKEEPICIEYPRWEDEDPKTEMVPESVSWESGWNALFDIIGRYSFNVGPIHHYSKWSVGIEEQRYDRSLLKDTRWHNSVSATQILPFDEAYTGRPAVAIL